MPVSLQVTLGANATQISASAIFVQTLVMTNLSPNDARFGDSTVVAGAYPTGKGQPLSAGGGSYNTTLNYPRGTILSQWYIAGTAGSVIEVLYEP